MGQQVLRVDELQVDGVIASHCGADPDPSPDRPPALDLGLDDCFSRYDGRVIERQVRRRQQ